MENMLIETIGLILGTIITGLIGIGFALLNKYVNSGNLKDALIMMEQACNRTAGQLQQNLVNDLKEASVDGKLTKEEIERIGLNSLNIVKSEMSDSAKKAIEAAGLDLNTLIQNQIEAWVAMAHNGVAIDTFNNYEA